MGCSDVELVKKVLDELISANERAIILKNVDTDHITLDYRILGKPLGSVVLNEVAYLDLWQLVYDVILTYFNPNPKMEFYYTYVETGYRNCVNIWVNEKIKVRSLSK